MGSQQSGQVDDVSVTEAWDHLKSDAASVLVDVRTRAEWAFVGVPDLTTIDKRPVMVEWQSFPDNRIDQGFAEKLAAMLETSGIARTTDIFFICRSGGRSKMAAQVMTAAGYTRCHNVADGFEGPLDSERHRGRLGGWKAAGLPWVQG